MVKFIINNQNDRILEYTNNNFTILDIKNDIIKVLNLECKYIDIDFQIDRPIRSMSKFNIEKGILPRTLDRYTLDRFAFYDKMDDININCHIVNNYDNNVNKIKSSNKKYVPPNKRDNVIINLSSLDEFPSLSI